uniref:Anaphase-promoting complex subunit 4 n=1 Tax=Lepisosteus oculatus TaxID=7918 RepID=W5N9M5_LEPOC|nr:PREDICTED: anaphase-promoting complex subunit 4 isoform X2 [Lepisosteus oculatus]
MPAFRQVGEKQLPNAVLFMVWSPKRDLIALANRAGELLLHRLANFQRVWSLPPNENTGKKITSLAWRPDGKILAFSVGDTKQVILCDVEKAEILHSFPVEQPVSCMHWMDVSEDNSVFSSFYNEDESDLFLPKLPALPESYSTTSKIFSEDKSDEIMNLLGEVRLNILVLGGESGYTELYAYGMYKITTLTGVPGTCRSLCLSSDLKSLSLITEVKTTDCDPEIHYIQFDTSLLSSCLPEVTRMARKFTHISTLLQYQKLSLTCMGEAWEDILMQMDLRLTKFVQEKNTDTSVQDEFLDLLLWGKSSRELKALLMNQLTVKGLKKLGQSIESSYSNIQKLVISHLQSGSKALLYHLSELKGMALWKQKYDPLGLDASGIEDAITAVGSFTLKANELLQVIDKSMKNFKAFFRWLYGAMLRMSEDHVLPELSKMTQKDIAFVADFLSENFSEQPELYDRKGKYFNVERVGQYLKDEDEDLVSPPNTEGNQWTSFVQNSTHLKESPLLFPYYPEKSLHFVRREMEGVIELCLQKPAEIIGKSVTLATSIPLYTVPASAEVVPRLFNLPSLWNDKKSSLHYVVFTMPEVSPCKLYVMRRATDPSRSIPNGLLAIDLGNFLNSSIDESAEASRYSCLDARMYDDETLTVVLKEAVEEEEESRGRILAQLPLSPVYTGEDEFAWDPLLRLDQQSGGIPAHNLVLENQRRTLENMKAQYVAVNGIRKVACVLSRSLQHIRVFEMDVEDEEEEDRLESQDAGADPDRLEESLGGQEQGGQAAGEGQDASEEQPSTSETVTPRLEKDSGM